MNINSEVLWLGYFKIQFGAVLQNSKFKTYFKIAFCVALVITGKFQVI